MGIRIEMFVGDNDTLKVHPDITPDGWIPLDGHGCQDEDEMREYVTTLDHDSLRLRIAEIEGETKDLPKVKRLKMKSGHGWPTDGKPADFSDLVAPIVKAIKFTHTLDRQNTDKDVPWDGPNIGASELACCFDPLYALSAEMLAYDEEDQGRDALEVIIGIALQIGIEQGRRIENTSSHREHEKFMRDMDKTIHEMNKNTIDELRAEVKRLKGE